MPMQMSQRDKGRVQLLNDFQWDDERFRYLQISIQIIAIVSLVCATAEIVFGCWSLNILSSKAYPPTQISSTESKHVAIGVAIVLTLSARIIALLAWVRSTRNKNLRCYSVTAHCTFLSIFVMLGLGGLFVYFLSASFDSVTGTFKPDTEVLLVFTYVAGFDIVFSTTFGFAVSKDLQSKIRREWELSDGAMDLPRENWVRPISSSPKWRESPPFHEVYV